MSLSVQVAVSNFSRLLKSSASAIARLRISHLCLWLVAFGAAPAAAAEEERPNILFCLADDWGWPHAGAYGDRSAPTPAFDRLAREGVLFERAFVSSPSCTPSRNAMLTGQQFYRLGEGASLHSALNVDHPNFMYLLKEAGYRIGHWRKAWGPGDFEAGGYAINPCGPEIAFTDFMKKRPAGAPFCFWFGTADPHRGYKKGSGAAGGIDPAEVRVPKFLPDNSTVRNDLADYLFEVRRWNHDVAAALELLERAGELDNTIVVMTGDHGMPFPRCKGNVYDWGARVPLAVRWGKHAPGGRRVSDFVSLTDLAPTFLAAAGVEIPKSMTGRSLLDILRGDEQGQVDPSRDFVVIGRERHVVAQEAPSRDGYPMRAIRTDRWLYILNLEPERWPQGAPDGALHPLTRFADCDDGPTKQFLMQHRDSAEIRPYFDLCFARRPAEELYDVEADPDQVHNLASESAHRATADRLRAQLTAYLRDTADPRFTGAPVEFDNYPYRAPYDLRRAAQ